MALIKRAEYQKVMSYSPGTSPCCGFKRIKEQQAGNPEKIILSVTVL